MTCVGYVGMGGLLDINQAFFIDIKVTNTSNVKVGEVCLHVTSGADI
jgi:hypothetical protein